MNLDEVRTLLPHRFPILLIDQVLGLVPGESIVAVKAVTGNEPWYAGSAATLPDYPAVLVMESWAQAAGVLALAGPAEAAGPGGVMLFGGATDVAFLAPVYPGELLEHHVRVERRFPDALFFTGESRVNGTARMRVGSMMMAFRPEADLAGDGPTTPNGEGV
ncbi:3-hydroxyacyl-ACP dehydratase FabZ family protein [Micromonospora tarensis]|uniref:Beta-hydroxyacyl-ACP dehydratase n=1 Tax=Micromonospora tarensis TaxID=2806100 RepID=A0ABS1YKT9_9ACTN|nr:beta-hydroxyacyl-ACP dehydratase [Micromonospora tarensis]MBM0278021.1 beta-hydroxyacyl-ACP dehydratase [Micromonospora tarensis]